MIRFGFVLAASMVAYPWATSLTIAAAEPVANMGTLTCIATPNEKDTLGPARKLSCSFEPLVGTKAEFTGVMKQAASDVPSDAKVVLVWAVLAPKVETDVSQLQGHYRGVAGAASGDNADMMIGGVDGSIGLKPVTPDPDPGANGGPTLLELELSAMKA